MTLTVVAAVLGLLAPCQEVKVTWASLKSGVPSKWSARARYPLLADQSPLSKAFNREMKFVCEAAYRETVEANGQVQAPKDVVVSGLLSVVYPSFVSGLVSVEKDGEPIELTPVSVWMSGHQPLRAAWSSLMKPGTDAELFARQVLLPVLNTMRQKSALAPLAEFPPGLLDGFVQTKSNVSWIVPPGVTGRDADQLKVPIATALPWLDPHGVLGHLVPAPKGITVPIGILISWQAREGLPANSQVEVSLKRDRSDVEPLARRLFTAQDPPMDLRFDMENVAAQQQERLFLEVKIVSFGQTLYRNRTPERIPVEGWQTIHEIRLDRDRSLVETF